MQQGALHHPSAVNRKTALRPWTASRPVLLMIGAVKEHLKPGRFGRNLFFAIGQTGLETASATLATLVVARIFGPTLFGVLGLYLFGVNFVTSLLDGYWQAQTKEVAETTVGNPRSAAALGLWSTACCIAISALLGVLVYLGFVVVSRGDIQTDLLTVLAAAGALIGRVGKSSLEASLRGLQRFQASAMAALVFAPLQGAALVLVAVKGGGVLAYLLVTAVSQILNSIVLLIAYMRGEGKLSHPLPREELRAMLVYAAPLMLRAFVSLLYLRINTPLIAKYATVGDVGQFRLSEQFALLPFTFVGGVVVSLAPKIAAARKRGETEQAATLLARCYAIVIAIMLPCAVAYWFNHVVVIRLFPKYVLASEFIALFALTLIPRGLSQVTVGALLVAGGENRAALRISVLASIFNVIVVWAGAAYAGAPGAIYATVAVQILVATLTIPYAHRLAGIPFRVRFS